MDSGIGSRVLASVALIIRLLGGSRKSWVELCLCLGIVGSFFYFWYPKIISLSMSRDCFDFSSDSSLASSSFSMKICAFGPLYSNGLFFFFGWTPQPWKLNFWLALGGSLLLPWDCDAFTPSSPPAGPRPEIFWFTDRSMLDLRPLSPSKLAWILLFGKSLSSPKPNVFLVLGSSLSDLNLLRSLFCPSNCCFAFWLAWFYVDFKFNRKIASEIECQLSREGAASDLPCKSPTLL